MPRRIGCLYDAALHASSRTMLRLSPRCEGGREGSRRRRRPFVGGEKAVLRLQGQPSPANRVDLTGRSHINLSAKTSFPYRERRIVAGSSGTTSSERVGSDRPAFTFTLRPLRSDRVTPPFSPSAWLPSPLLDVNLLFLLRPAEC